MHSITLAVLSQENPGKQGFANEDTEAERTAAICPLYIATK